MQSDTSWIFSRWQNCAQAEKSTGLGKRERCASARVFEMSLVNTIEVPSNITIEKTTTVTDVAFYLSGCFS